MEIENSGRREYKMIWKIENFRYAWHKMGEKLVSPEFVIRNSSWKLEIYPRGVENEEYIGCFLARTDNCTFWDGTVHYQFFATQSGGLTKTFVKDRVYLQCGEKDGFPLFVKREEIIDGIQPLTLTCKMVILYNATSIFCLESFVRTHIMVEHLNFSYYFESEAIIASKQISVISPTEMKPLFDVYLILLQKHNLQIKLIPAFNGSERLKYYTCRLAVHDVLTTERLWKCSFEDWGEFKWKDVNVNLSHFNESREGNRVIEFKNRSLHLELEFTFSTGEDLTINEHTVSRRS